MTKKQVTIAANPGLHGNPATEAADRWVNRAPPAQEQGTTAGATPPAAVPPAAKDVGDDEEMMRLTFDCPKKLHRAIKMACAMRGTKMNQEIIALLKSHYPYDENE